ncbi:MAG: hypothetical protein DCE90_19025 [Pseudanabaena sp.]|nr:MAG: hypothetical protein DCE90_19025 [Pseudanabaena sp.]
MSESIALELPESLAKKVKEIAALNRQGIEEMLIEWIDRTINEIPIEALPDEQVLALCNLQMGGQQQRIFSDLQARNSEELLNAQEVKKLNELMHVYRYGSVRKAKAMQVAVMRRLIPALNDFSYS